jgi:hypothetical protein
MTASWRAFHIEQTHVPTLCAPPARKKSSSDLSAKRSYVQVPEVVRSLPEPFVVCETVTVCAASEVDS